MFFNAHVVGGSVSPFFMGLGVLSLFLSLVVFFKGGFLFFLFFSLFFMFLNFFVWMKDVYMEGVSGYHNFFVDKGFGLGFVIFIFTEVMFFFSIFWVFLDNVWLGGFVWWPCGYLDFLGLPLFGTLVLLSSGLVSTWCHNAVISGLSCVNQLLVVVCLGVLFVFVQFYEYGHLFFNISDGWGGSVFYFLTGFHGFHVMLGVFLLLLCLVRFVGGFISFVNNYFFEGSVIYWHFVDVVWLLLYLLIYVYG